MVEASSLSELIAMLEAASGGSRDLDFAIGKVIGRVPASAEVYFDQLEAETFPEISKFLALHTREWATPEYVEYRNGARACRDSEELAAYYERHPDAPVTAVGECTRGTLAHYTTSLDAALSLVPDLCEVHLSLYGGPARATAYFDGGEYVESDEKPSAALALVIAALKARARQASPDPQS